MNHPYTGMMGALEHLQDKLLQVCVYKDILQQHGAVIIMDEDPDGWLEKLSPLARYIHKKGLVLPLIINRRFIRYSLDSYPLEFINIISSERENLHLKEDLLANLDFVKSDVRLQMEREFKSKWLLTRQIVLEGKLSSRRLSETMQISIRSVLPALKGFFLLAGQPYPKNLPDLFAQSTIITKIDINAMQRWMDEKHIEIADVERYLSILHKLMELMETYPVEP